MGPIPLPILIPIPITIPIPILIPISIPIPTPIPIPKNQQIFANGFERVQASPITSITTCLQTGYFNYVVYFYIFTATSNLFLPILNIFMHIPNYFHVYLYIYLPIFTTKVWYLTTVYHISVVFYHSLPVFIYIYHKSVVFYYSLTQKCGILVQFTTKVWLEMYLKMRYKQTMYLMYLR